MRKHQTGEVILVMMIVMLAVVWLGSGHMGMGKMEDGAAHAEKSGNTKQQTDKKLLPTFAPQESIEIQN